MSTKGKKIPYGRWEMSYEDYRINLKAKKITRNDNFYKTNINKANESNYLLFPLLITSTKSPKVSSWIY